MDIIDLQRPLQQTSDWTYITAAVSCPSAGSLHPFVGD